MSTDVAVAMIDGVSYRACWPLPSNASVCLVGKEPTSIATDRTWR